jgi:cysteine synthase A
MLARLTLCGARIDWVGEDDAQRHGSLLDARIARARELCRRPRHADPDQYGSAINPAIHACTTGPELLAAIPGPLAAVLVTAGTGGQLAGIGACVKRLRPRTRVVAVDVEGSAIFGGVPRRRLVTGLGSSRPSQFITPAVYDEVVAVSDREAIGWCRGLSARTGVALGGSSGAGLAAAWRYLQRHPEAETVALVCPDGGAAYTSTIYDDGWLRAHGLLAADLACAGSVRSFDLPVAA